MGLNGKILGIVHKSGGNDAGPDVFGRDILPLKKQVFDHQDCGF